MRSTRFEFGYLGRDGSSLSRSPEPPSLVILFVLPAWNEESTLPRLLESIRREMNQARLEYRVLVVDDGSEDGTADAVDRAAGFMPIQCLRHPRNLGLGEALKTGLREAVRLSVGSDIIVTMDADNTQSPDLIAQMAQMVNAGSDVVIASRYRKGARVVGVPALRRFLSFGASLLFRTFFPIPGVRDYTCGYRAYSAQLLREMFETHGDRFISEQGFSCMAEILLKIRERSVTAGEVPLVLRYDRKVGESGMKVARTVMKTLELIVRRRVARG